MLLLVLQNCPVAICLEIRAHGMLGHLSMVQFQGTQQQGKKVPPQNRILCLCRGSLSGCTVVSSLETIVLGLQMTKVIVTFLTSLTSVCIKSTGAQPVNKFCLI